MVLPIKPLKKPKHSTIRRFSDERVWQMRDLVRKGEVTISWLAEKRGVSRATIRAAIYGTGAYKDV